MLMLRSCTDHLKHYQMGNKQKCCFFTVLNAGQFLLIDEPTNHLDTDARKIVSDYLRKKKGFILISHDRIFLDGCVDHIYLLIEQILKFKVVTILLGS